MKNPELSEAVKYVDLVAKDAATVKVTWDFDEQQADPCHHNFDGRRFIRCLKVVVAELKTILLEGVEVGEE